MAIKIGANLAYNGKLPNFERDSFETKAAMKAFDENSIDEGHLSYCKEDGNVYQYKHTNIVDTTTGRWRLFKTEADATLNGTSTNAIQNKAVFDALKVKADAVALAAYQPKYNADYVATKDFNYSELPDDIRVIDLNGYVMNIKYSSDTVTIDNKEFYNGMIYINNGNVSVSDSIFFNSFINSIIDIPVDTSTFYYCRINGAFIETGTICYFCKLDFSTINTSHALMCCIAEDCDYNAVDIGSEPIAYCSYLSDKYYINAIIVDGHLAEYNFETDVDNPVVKGNAPSCEAVKTALQSKADKTQLNDLATKTELSSKADKTQLNNYVTTATANSTYAKKSDITNIYKFKGTKTNYAELPTTNRVTGDVWNITNADAEHGIKAGDNVAWNGTAWDNLSGTVDLSAYATTTTTDAMSADIKKLMDKTFPFTVKVSIDKTLAKKGTSQAVKVTITPKIGDDNTNVDEIMINGAEHHGAIPYVYSDTATTTTTYNVRADKDGRTAQGSATITFVNPSYDGAVAANFTATEANIKALTETLRSGKGGTRTFNLNNQKACIAYPKAFGAATGIKDANGFDYLASYTRSELNVNGELYYVYLLTNAVTITDMKQIIS